MPKRANSIQNPSTYITNETSKKLIGKKNEAIARELAGVHGSISDALDNINFATETINQRKNKMMELEGLLNDEHSKFIKVMGMRTKSIQGILYLWAKGNVKPIISAMKKYTLNHSVWTYTLLRTCWPKS